MNYGGTPHHSSGLNAAEGAGGGLLQRHACMQAGLVVRALKLTTKVFALLLACACVCSALV
jgi:hypothetical protein